MGIGRPSQLTKQRTEKVLAAIRTGSPLHIAASYAGITPTTLRNWRRRAEAAMAKPSRETGETDRRYIAFFSQLDEAMSECAVRMQEVVYSTATSGAPDEEASLVRVRVQAATWWLTHTQAAHYSPRHEVTGPGGGPIELDTKFEESVTSLVGRMVRASQVEDEEVQEA